MHQKLEFTIRGKVNGVEITPQTIGLSLFNQFNQEVEDFLKGSQRTLKLNEVRVRIEDGSYKLVPTLTTAILVAITPDLRTLEREDSLGEVDAIRAEVVSKWQRRVKSESALAYEINAAGEVEAQISISKTTDYRVGQVTPWVRVEKYLFGRILDMGGAKTANIHLAIEGQPKHLVVSTTEDVLRDQRENRLYHQALLRIEAEQNIRTGELRNPHLVDFADYDPHYDEAALDRFIEAGTQAWADVPNAVEWVREMRGGLGRLCSEAVQARVAHPNRAEGPQCDSPGRSGAAAREVCSKEFPEPCKGGTRPTILKGSVPGRIQETRFDQ